MLIFYHFLLLKRLITVVCCYYKDELQVSFWSIKINLPKHLQCVQYVCSMTHPNVGLRSLLAISYLNVFHDSKTIYSAELTLLIFFVKESSMNESRESHPIVDLQFLAILLRSVSIHTFFIWIRHCILVLLIVIQKGQGHLLSFGFKSWNFSFIFWISSFRLFIFEYEFEHEHGETNRTFNR